MWQEKNHVMQVYYISTLGGRGVHEMLIFSDVGEGGLTKCLCKQKELNCTVGPISTWYFSVKVCQWNFDINMTNIICKLHAKLNFGIFCYSLRWLKKLLTFSSEIFFVTMFLFLPWKKRKQITTPISTFRFLYNKTLLQCDCWNCKK